MSEKATRAPLLGHALRLLIAGAALSMGAAHAQTVLLNDTHTIAAPDQGVPVEHSVAVPAAGTYKVTLTDLGAALPAPNSAPLASVKLAITSGNTLIGTPLVGAGSMNFTATAAGTYVVRVIGAPTTTPGSGPFGVQITKSDGSQLDAFSDTLALPPSVQASNQATLDSSFTVAATGSYTVTLTDLLVPQALDTLTLLVVAEGSSSPTTILPVPGSNPPYPAAQTATVTLQSSTNYRIFAVGQSTTANAGLYSVIVRPQAGGPSVFSQTLPVGTVTLLGAPSLAASTYTLTLSDLAYPSALMQIGAAIVVDGAAITPSLSAPGIGQPFTLSSAVNAQVFALATPSSTATVMPNTGSYTVQVLAASGPPAFSVAQAVAAPGATTTAYTFNTNIAAAGSYTAQLADFQVPATLTNVGLAAVQGGVLQGTPLTTVGNLTLNATASNLSLLVFATATSSGGLLGVDVVPAGGGSPVYTTTQGVGGLFTVKKITVSSAGKYGVATSDVGFPAKFGDLAVVVSQGAAKVGSIFGSQSLTFDATAGDYYVSLLAQPSGTDKAGTYGLSVASAPTVTLTATPTSVASGGTVSLAWSGQNVDTCTASGGWTGNLSGTSGTQASSAVTAATTFTVTCTGLGGSATASANVTISSPTPPPTGGGHGGGGAIQWELLAALTGVLARRRWHVRGADR
jgi:hypothetical protein